MASKTSESTEARSGTKVIATWKPGQGIPGLRREITKKQAKDALEVDLEKDLVWEASNHFRVDVSAVPEALLEVLRKDNDFKVADES